MIVSDFNHFLEDMNEVLQGGHPHLELGTEHHCDPPVLSLCVFLLTRCSDLQFYTSRAMCFGRNAFTQWFAQDRLQSFAPPSEGRPSSAAPLSGSFSISNAIPAASAIHKNSAIRDFHQALVLLAGPGT